MLLACTNLNGRLRFGSCWMITNAWDCAAWPVRPWSASERAHFVLLSDQGKSAPEIGALMGYSAQAVYPWLERYTSQGVAGLYEEARSGRPPKKPYLLAIVQAQMGQPPASFGYPEAGWTVAGVLRHLRQRFKVAVSASTLRRALPGSGLVWGRPKLVLPQSPRSAGGRQDRLPDAGAGPAAGHHLGRRRVRDDVAAGVAGHLAPPRGAQPRVLTPGQNRKHPVFGTVNLRTGQWHYRLTERKRSVEFIAALE